MADDVLYGRRLRLSIAVPVSTPGDYAHTTSDVVTINGADDPEEPGLRVRFKVVKTSEKNPNPAEVTVSNLSPSRRASLQVKGVRVLLEAGYAATGLSQLFAGDLRTVDHKREGADWETTLRCGDGERGYKFARASQSFAAGAKVGDVVLFCAKSLGLPLGNAAQQAAALSRPLFGGWTTHGPASAELDRVLRAVGYSWSIQDGQIQVLGKAESLQTSIPLVSPETGLVGSPEAGSPEHKGGARLVKFRTLLLPQARPGARVHLRSARYDGVFRVKKATHSGDVSGGDWYTDVEGVADSTLKAAP